MDTGAWCRHRRAVRTARHHWTRFEERPQFVTSVESVRQRDDTPLHWTAGIGGVRCGWDADITAQTPDERIAWCAMGGSECTGVAASHTLGEGCTVMLQVGLHPEGVVEQAGDESGFVRRRAEDDVERSKEFLESRGTETQLWWGEVLQDAS